LPAAYRNTVKEFCKSVLVFGRKVDNVCYLVVFMSHRVAFALCVGLYATMRG